MFFCEICGYSSLERSGIHEHHIIPKELGGLNKKFNLVMLCPTCHGLCYIKESCSGNHSIQKQNSFIIKGWLKSTAGNVLNYIDKNGNERLELTKNINFHR